MNILYFYQYFGTPKGSWSTRVYEFTRRWADEGDHVTVVTSVFDKSDLAPKQVFSTYEIEGVTVHVINLTESNRFGFWRRVYGFLAYAVLSSWYAFTAKADVVVASSGPITIGLPGLIARHVRRIPMVFEVRDLWPEGAIQLNALNGKFAIGLARWFESRCYRSANRIVALSDGMADWIRREHGHNHISVVPNSCDNELFSRDTATVLPDWAWRSHLVLYTGSLGLMDDCKQLVHMASYLRDSSDIQVVFLGEGKDRERLEMMAKDLDLKNVHFLGLIPKVELIAWLQVARCCLLSFHRVEVLNTVSPNKMFDAFAAGVPIVQSTQGWIKELIDIQRCGLNAPREDAEAMADAVRSICRDDELYRELSDNAKRVALELFDRDYLSEKMRMALDIACSRRVSDTMEYANPKNRRVLSEKKKAHV